MRAACPRLVIAGTGSGVGKTSITLGLARALVEQGLRVQPFKVGPDFLDPSYLAAASGRVCYNLDGWMTSRAYVRQLFARATADADIALIEGVMGLFDGASPSSLEGSTAEIALWLDAPVLLVVNAHGVAGSLAAIVKGFSEYERNLFVAGVIANQGGSARHRECLSAALKSGSTAPLVGMMPRGSFEPLPRRHLGLVAAGHAGLRDEMFHQAAAACSRHLDLPAIVALARSAREFEIEEPREAPTAVRELRIGIAQDEAFHFYYPDNLEALSRLGVEWASFSPLADARLPDDLDGLYFGGGYPEVHAERLAANAGMIDEIRRFVAGGGVVYAECGGLMYLGRSLATTDGAAHAMAGVLPIRTAMLPRLKTLGYAEVCWTADSLWGRAGQTARGHEFHYSEIVEGHQWCDGWQPAFAVRRRGEPPAMAGFCKENVLAGYVHLHWASRPDAIRHFVSRFKRS